MMMVAIRFAHEMNGGWYPYGVAFKSPGQRHNGNTPADYVAMLRHVVQRLRGDGVSHAVMVWNVMGFAGWGDGFEALGVRYVGPLDGHACRVQRRRNVGQ